MTAHGQLDLEGNEDTGPRIERAARSLWWRDASRTWGQDGNDIAKERAKALWPRIKVSYLAEAETALRAAGVLP